MILLVFFVKRTITLYLGISCWRPKKPMPSNILRSRFHHLVCVWFCVQVVSQRAHILRPLVEMGVDVLYSDTDITWFKSPWEHIPDLDTPNQCDYYVQQEKSEVIGDYNCSGFMFIRASEITKLFMKVCISLQTGSTRLLAERSIWFYRDICISAKLYISLTCCRKRSLNQEFSCYFTPHLVSKGSRDFLPSNHTTWTIDT